MRAISSTASMGRQADTVLAAAPEEATARLQSALEGLRASPHDHSAVQQPDSIATQQEPRVLLPEANQTMPSSTAEEALDQLWPRWPDQATLPAHAQQQPDSSSQLMALLDDPAFCGDWDSGSWLPEAWAAEAPQQSMLEPAMSVGDVTQQALHDGTMSVPEQTLCTQPLAQLSRGSEQQQQEAVPDRRSKRRGKQQPNVCRQQSSPQSALLSSAQPDEPYVAPGRQQRGRNFVLQDARSSQSSAARSKDEQPDLAPVRTGRAGGLISCLKDRLAHCNAWLLRAPIACAGADSKPSRTSGSSFGGITQSVIQAAARSSTQGPPPVFRLEELAQGAA